MPAFGKNSLVVYNEIHPLFRKIFDEVIKYYDFALLDGWRSQAEQDSFVSRGLSLTSKRLGHGTWPATACDIAPYPIKWYGGKAIQRFYFLAGRILQEAQRQGIALRWGGDWDGDNDIEDQTFDDIGHFELIGQYIDNKFVRIECPVKD